MTNIDIASLIGTPNAIIQKFGLKIYETAVDNIETGATVQLDFSGLRNATTGFFHASVGNLYKKYGDAFYTVVKFNGLEQQDWKEKFQDAIDVVSDPKKALEIDQAISELFE